MTPTNDLITPEQVAREYKFAATGTLANWRFRGWPHLPFVKISSKVFYRRTDVEAFITSHTVGGTQDAA